MGDDGLDADDLRQNHIYDPFFRHLSPCLAVVVILAEHQFFGFFEHLVIQPGRLLAAHVNGIGIALAVLDNRHNAVVDHGAEVAFYIVTHKAHARLLTLTDITDLDV